jgi:hypothetical protein
MMSEAYNAATTIYYYWGLFFKSVADKLGLEKAYELHEDSVGPIGSTYEAMVNEQYPDGLDLKAFGEFTVESLNATGWTSEMSMDGKDKMTVKMTKCPRYDGFKMAGLGDDEIKEHCMRQVKILEASMQKADPHIRFEVPIWDAPNGRCDEVFWLE